MEEERILKASLLKCVGFIKRVSRSRGRRDLSGGFVVCGSPYSKKDDALTVATVGWKGIARENECRAGIKSGFETQLHH